MVSTENVDEWKEKITYCILVILKNMQIDNKDIRAVYNNNSIMHCIEYQIFPSIDGDDGVSESAAANKASPISWEITFLSNTSYLNQCYFLTECILTFLTFFTTYLF